LPARASDFVSAARSAATIQFLSKNVRAELYNSTEKNLDKLVKWCQRGPLFAKVEKVEIEEKEITGYENFEIKY